MSPDQQNLTQFLKPTLHLQHKALITSKLLKILKLILNALLLVKKWTDS